VYQIVFDPDRQAPSWSSAFFVISRFSLAVFRTFFKCQDLKVSHRLTESSKERDVSSYVLLWVLAEHDFVSKAVQQSPDQIISSKAEGNFVGLQQSRAFSEVVQSRFENDPKFVKSWTQPIQTMTSLLLSYCSDWKTQSLKSRIEACDLYPPILSAQLLLCPKPHVDKGEFRN
jgi:hypothetical protein